jgi:hypothetical protein
VREFNTSSSRWVGDCLRQMIRQCLLKW